MPRRPVPRDAVPGAGLRGRARRASRSGTASPSSPGWGWPTSRTASPACRRGASEDVDPAPEARALGATCGGVRVWSLYVPNGRALADPHLQYKLRLAGGAAGRGRRVARPTTPRRRSPWSATGTSPRGTRTSGTWRVFATTTHVSPPERAAFRGGGRGRLRRRRPAVPPGPGVYTYWDYTQLRFPRREGMRIDFVLGSPALAGRVTGARDRPRRSARARAPATTRRSSSSSPTDRRSRRHPTVRDVPSRDHPMASRGHRAAGDHPSAARRIRRAQPVP